MKKLWDCHMHTSFSGDSEAPPFDMIARAKEIGLGGIIFTDHLDWDFAMLPHQFDLDIDHYLEEMPEIAAQESDEDFGIFVGLELGLQEHLVPRHQKLLDERHFDYVIGSIHQVNGFDPYYPECYEGRTVAAAYDEFLQTTIKNIEAFPHFDSLGHLDFMLRYGAPIAAERGETADLTYRGFADQIDYILALLINHDIALEVNTGSFKRNLKEPNPSWEILRRYRHLGGRLLTLGADAHEPKHVGLKLSETVEQLKSIGFTSYYVYRHRTPVEYPL